MIPVYGCTLIPLKRRFKTFQRYIRAPSRGWLLARMLVWAAILPILKRWKPLRSLVPIMRSPPRIVGRKPDLEKRIEYWAYKIFPPTRSAAEGRCLERSLILYRFLSELNAAPRMLIGFSKTDETVFGHAWVVVDEKPVGEQWESHSDFIPVTVFDSEGIAQSLGPATDSFKNVRE